MSTSSGLHLTLKVAWHHLAPRFTSYCDPGIELPIGVCGRIHAHTRKTQLQLANRSYLSNHVCTSQDNCDEHNGTKVFRKNNKLNPVTLERTNQSQRPIAENATAYNRFIDSLSSAIREFAKTERNKVIQRKVMSEDEQKKLIDKLRQKLRQT